MPNRGSTSGRDAGFTFTEVLVAMGITVAVILGYSLSTIGVMRGNTATENSTIAIQLAQDKVEQLKALRILVDENRCPGGGDHRIGASPGRAGIFARCWTITTFGSGSNLKQIDVTVSWQDHENRALTLSTLVFIESDT
jgi:hypothetical protein